jgi:hypothetical protein
MITHSRPERVDTATSLIDPWGMAQRKLKKLPRDVNSRAFAIGELATSETAPEPGTTGEGKNLAAVALGRLGGLKGGKARAEKLSKSQRSASAKKAAAARWKKRQD